MRRNVQQLPPPPSQENQWDPSPEERRAERTQGKRGIRLREALKGAIERRRGKYTFFRKDRLPSYSFIFYACARRVRTKKRDGRNFGIDKAKNCDTMDV